jgi:general secretion pathway protein J
MTSGAHNNKGFTLLELLVAMSIFALLAAMSYGGLQAVLNQQWHTEQGLTAATDRW